MLSSNITANVCEDSHNTIYVTDLPYVNKFMFPYLIQISYDLKNSIKIYQFLGQIY